MDQALVDRALVATRSKAKAVVMAGDVLVNGAVVNRAGWLVQPGDGLALVVPPRFVSRGGEKLAKALVEFGIDVAGWTVADFGASTGGFTDCLLQGGACRVYAVDVGYGILADKIRRDDRVVVMERTNARYLEGLPEPIDLVTIDVSFIALKLMLPVAARVLRPGGSSLALIKPQFEAGRRDVGKGGVVRDPLVHRRVLGEVLGQAVDHGFGVKGLIPSPLRGPAGNVEFLVHLVLGESSIDPAPLIESAMETLPA